MVIEWPLVWITLFYIAGIIVGYCFALPFYYYGIVAFAILLVLTILRKHGHMFDVAHFGIWLLIGCMRICMPQMPEDTPLRQLAYNLQDAAREGNALFMQRLEKSGLNGEPLAISVALLSGDKSYINKETRQVFANVGASHLLALSGLHLGILYGLLYFIFIRRLLSSDWKWFVLPPLLLCIWGYAWFACMPISLVRAAIMLSILSVYTLSGGDVPALHVLALSAFVILLVSPTQLFSISFQLSYSATLFIVWFQKPVRMMFSLKGNRVLTLLSVSIVAQMGTMPLVMYYFHTFSPIAAPLSIILIPLTTVIVYMVLMTAIFPFTFMADILEALINSELHFMKWSASLPLANINGLYIEPWQVVVLYISFICLLIRTSIIMKEYKIINR